MRAADARRGLQEVQLAIIAPADELAVRNAAHQAEGFQYPFIKLDQRSLFVRAAWQSASGKDVAFVRDIHRGTPITTGDGEERLALVEDRVYVVDVAGHVLLQQI